AKFLPPRKFHELCRLSIVEIARDPFRLLSFYAELIELIASALKDEEAMTEVLKLPRKFFVNWEGFGRKQPIFVGEKPFCRKGASNRIQFVGNGKHQLKSGPCAKIKLSAARGQVLERQPNEFLGAFRSTFLLDLAHGFVRFHLLVAKRDQCEHRFVGLLLLGCGRMYSTGHFPRAGAA